MKGGTDRYEGGYRPVPRGVQTGMKGGAAPYEGGCSRVGKLKDLA